MIFGCGTSGVRFDRFSFEEVPDTRNGDLFGAQVMTSIVPLVAILFGEVVAIAGIAAYWFGLI